MKIKDVADLVIDALNKQIVPWRQAWTPRGGSSLPASLSTGKPYRGMNTWLLAVSAATAGYTSRWWGTANTIAKHGGSVNPGEAPTVIILLRWVFPKREDTPGDSEEVGTKKRRMVPLMRTFEVYNTDQCTGVKLPAGAAVVVGPGNEYDPIAEAEAVIAAMPEQIKTVHGFDRVCYVPVLDEIHMPFVAQYNGGVANYYHDRLHEIGHATGHPTRLGRIKVEDSGLELVDTSYSEEELVAEMFAGVMAGMCGLSIDIDNTLAYCKGWASRFEDKPYMVIKAANAAQKAVDWALGVAGGEEHDN